MSLMWEPSWDGRYPRIGYGSPSGHNGGPAGPLAVQFACFDASSGIQQRIGELNHSGGGEEGEGRINYLWISAVYSNCHTTHVYTCIATVTLHMMYTSPECNTV